MYPFFSRTNIKLLSRRVSTTPGADCALPTRILAPTVFKAIVRRRCHHHHLRSSAEGSSVGRLVAVASRPDERACVRFLLLLFLMSCEQIRRRHVTPFRGRGNNNMLPPPSYGPPSFRCARGGAKAAGKVRKTDPVAASRRVRPSGAVVKATGVGPLATAGGGGEIWEWTGRVYSDRAFGCLQWW